MAQSRLAVFEFVKDVLLREADDVAFSMFDDLLTGDLLPTYLLRERWLLEYYKLGEICVICNVPKLSGRFMSTIGVFWYEETLELCCDMSHYDSGDYFSLFVLKVDLRDPDSLERVERWCRLVVRHGV